MTSDIRSCKQQEKCAEGDLFPLGEAFADFVPISYLYGISTKGPSHSLHGSNIPPLIDWTRRVIPASDLPLIRDNYLQNPQTNIPSD